MATEEYAIGYEEGYRDGENSVLTAQAQAVNQQLLIDYIKDDLGSATADGWCIVHPDDDKQKLQILESAGILLRHPTEPGMIKISAAAQEQGK